MNQTELAARKQWAKEEYATSPNKRLHPDCICSIYIWIEDKHKSLWCHLESCPIHGYATLAKQKFEFLEVEN